MLCFSSSFSSSLSAVLWLPLSLSLSLTETPFFPQKQSQYFSSHCPVLPQSGTLIAGGTVMGVRGVGAGRASAAQSTKNWNDTWWFVVVYHCSATSVYPSGSNGAAASKLTVCITKTLHHSVSGLTESRIGMYIWILDRCCWMEMFVDAVLVPWFIWYNSEENIKSKAKDLYLKKPYIWLWTCSFGQIRNLSQQLGIASLKTCVTFQQRVQ